MNVEIIGLIAALLTTSSFLPQVIRVWKTKSTKDISLTMYINMFIGVGLWLAYGIAIDSLSVILANSVTIVLVLSILYFKLKYK